MRVILCSGSSRRRDILNTAGIKHEVIVSDCEEKLTSKVPSKVVCELSYQKVMDVFRKTDFEQGREEDTVLIGADTIVAFGDEIYGKPKDVNDAKAMLGKLSGKTHQVYTGVTFIYLPKNADKNKSLKKTFYEKTEVNVAALTEGEIVDYVNSGEPMDKAGAYGIQGLFSKYILGINGDYNNVVGFPVARFVQELKNIINI